MASTLVPGPDKEPPNKRLINLIRGWPSPQLLPIAQLRSAAERVLTDPAVAVPALQYAPDPGYQPLREELARWLSEGYGVPTTADELAVTGGASQGLACVLQSFTDPKYTRAVWVVAPCYFLGCPIFEDAGFEGRLRAVPEDEGGIDLVALEQGLRESEREGGKGADKHRAYKSPLPNRKLYRHVIYLVATCANPSGKTLSLDRRRRLVEIAREHDALIISDDVYDFLQWRVTAPTTTSPSPLPSPSPSPSSSPAPLLTPLPLLSHIDAALGPSKWHHPEHNPLLAGKHFPHAISNGSFSKLAGPGVRTGWVHGTPDFALGFSLTGTNRSGGAASQLAAAVVHQVLATGELERHLTGTVRPALRRRHALVVGEVERVLGPLGVGVWRRRGGVVRGGDGGDEGAEEVFGGYFVWLTLPEGVDAGVLAERAEQEEKLIVAPGRLFEVSGDEEAARFPRNVRLTFSWEDEESLVEGVRRLGSVLGRMLRGESVQTPGARDKGRTEGFK